MILEHSNPHTVYNKHKVLLQSGNLSKIHHMVLTLPTGLLFLGQWHNTCKVTSSTARIIQEPNFCHDNSKYLAKMGQPHQGAVGLCKKIMTLKWNNSASFYVVGTVIQIMTQGTSLLEQSSLSFQCHICCFISWSEVKFPCGIIVVEVRNSTHLVLIIKYVFILKVVCFLSFLRHNIQGVSRL